MNEVSNWGNLFYNSLQTFGQRIMGSLPYIFGAIFILLIGWLIARFVSAGVIKLLKAVKFDKLTNRVKASDYLKKANIDKTPSELIGKFVYWLLILLVITTASDTLGWTIVSDEISRLLGYLPNLLVAIIIFIIGTTISSIVRDVISGATGSLGIATGKLVSEFVFYLLFTIVTLTALKQAGVDTSIITSNLLLIMGAILISASISYGFASKDVLANILASFFNRQTFKVGQKISYNGYVGKIIEINNVAIKVETPEGDLIVPSRKLLENEVLIK